MVISVVDTTTTVGQSTTVGEPQAVCENIYPTTTCDHWADIGECHKNPGFMVQNCRQSCKACIQFGEFFLLFVVPRDTEVVDI